MLFIKDSKCVGTVISDIASKGHVLRTNATLLVGLLCKDFPVSFQSLLKIQQY